MLGHWYFRARYFDDTLGRFIARDPLGYVDGYSMYRGYFAPKYMDPYGLLESDNPEEIMPPPRIKETINSHHISDFINHSSNGWDRSVGIKRSSAQIKERAEMLCKAGCSDAGLQYVEVKDEEDPDWYYVNDQQGPTLEFTTIRSVVVDWTSDATKYDVYEYGVKFSYEYNYLMQSWGCYCCGRSSGAKSSYLGEMHIYEKTEVDITEEGTGRSRSYFEWRDGVKRAIELMDRAQGTTTVVTRPSDYGDTTAGSSHGDSRLFDSTGVSPRSSSEQFGGARVIIQSSPGGRARASQ